MESREPVEAGGARTRPRRYEYVIVLIALAVVAVQCLAVMNTIAPTFDAFAHVPAGYNYLKQGNFEIYKHNPPLIQMIMALPLLFVQPDLPTEETSTALTRWEYARAFHELNVVDFDWIFFLARIPVMLLSLLLCYLVWRWCRRWFGPVGGLVGLSLLAFNPFFIAHSHLATLDVGTALTTTLVFWAAARFLDRRDWMSFAALAVFFGLAQAAKFSSILLFLVVPLLLFADLYWPGISDPDGRRRKRLRKPAWQLAGLTPLLLQCLILGAVFCVIVSVVFGFDRLFPSIGECHFVSRQMQGLQQVEGLKDIPIPLPYYYLEGVDAQNYLNQYGFANYLLGERSQKGFWNFFIVAFLAKMPLGFLTLLALAVPAWVLAFLKRRDMRWLFLLIPVLIFLLYFSFMITVQCGLRYLLPVIPLIVIFAAMAGKWLWPKGIAGKAAILVPIAANLISCVLIHPDYLAYFNAAWGGPANGHRVIVATDLDWGQDLKKARTYLREHPPDGEVQADLFGEMDPGTYGIPNAAALEKFPSPGWKLISIQLEINAFSPAPDRTWLQKFEPVATFGYTLHLFDIREEDLLRHYTQDQLRAFRIASEADRLAEEDPVEAERLMKEAAGLHPDCWQIHHLMGQFYLERDRIKEAKACFNKSLALNPDGEIYILLGKDDRAE